MRIFSLFVCIILLSKIGFAQPKRYVVHGMLNLEADVNHGISLMTKMVGQGCNAVELTIMWERIYAKPDSKPNWTQIDNQINHITKNLNVKLAIRIHLGRNFATINGFWDEASSIQDFKGHPLTVYYNNNHFSFAHQPSIDKAKSFVKEVVERYGYLQNSGQLIFVSVVNTPQQEAGYAYENQQWPQKEYTAIFDHSKFAMIKLRDWAKEKYTTIRTLNTYWGTQYRNFGEVEPYVNWWGVKDSFRGRRGKDWFLVRHEMLKSYFDQMTATIKSVNSTIKVAQEYGSVTDPLSLLRNTYGFKNLSNSADIIKTNSNYSLFEYDMILSNLKANQKYYSEVAVFDKPNSDEIKDLVPKIFRYNCEYLALYIDYDVEKDIQKFLPVIREANKYLNIEPQTPILSDTMKVRLSQMIDNQEEVLNEWKNISENGKKPIKVIFEEDIILENKKIENPLPDLPNQTVIISPPPKEDGPNQLPKEGFPNFTQEIVVGQTFQFRLPDNLYTDPDGFISFIEMIEAPDWLKFNRFENSFFGKAIFLGKNKVKLRVYDNKGASIESTIFIEALPPSITFELIKADYFDVPIVGLGNMVNNRTISLADIPEKVNIIARCNLDSVIFNFELTGAYKFKNTSDRPIYNLFGEGRGIQFPVGNYTLRAEAKRNDSLITWKSVDFRVVASTSPADSVLADWTVYPNPFLEICNIKLPNDEDFNKLNFAVFSSTGQKFTLQKTNMTYISKSVYIDFEKSNLPSGNYTLEISKENAVLKRFRVNKL